MAGVFEGIDNAGADWDRKDREEREALARKHRSLGLDPDWYENADQMAEDIAGRPASAQKAIQERVNSQRAGRGSFGRTGFATGVAPMMNHGASGAYHAAIGSAQQGKALGDMIAQTMAAHQDENDSRVSQEREMRRMMHEQEIERMRQETERMKIEALLARLNEASGGGRRVAFPGGSITYV